MHEKKRTEKSVPMSDEYEELALDTLEVDEETGEVRKASVVDEEPRNLPNQIKGSASLIEDYRSCPAKAYARLTRQPSEKSISLVLGTAVHEGLEKFVKFRQDPQKTFENALKFEAEKNKIPLNTKEASDAMLVGVKCVGAGIGVLSHKGPTGIPLYERLDQDYIERYFVLERNGRKYSGKIDFIAIMQNEHDYVVGDWKTGKNAPSKLKLQEDLQFSIYGWATKNDPAMRTYGRLMHHGVYMHLRGQSTELHDSGRRKAVKDTKDPSKVKHDFPVTRTEEQIEDHFNSRIEPVMAAMEQGIWYRNSGTFANPCSYCSYFNKDKERCEVELPMDSGEKKYSLKKTSEQLVNELKPEPAGMLFGPEVIDDSRKAGLKPYN
jgi:RecB family exonuclease